MPSISNPRSGVIAMDVSAYVVDPTTGEPIEQPALEEGGVPVTPTKSSTLTVDAVTCNDSADVLLAANPSRIRAVLRLMEGSPTAYIGPSDVATTDGYPVYPGDEVIIERFDGAIYGVTASGIATFRVMEH